MFGKFSSAYLEVVVWKFEQRTFYISLLRVKVILACQEVHKISLALNELRYIASSFKHAPQVGRKLLILYAKQPMENYRGPTLDGKSHSVERATIIHCILLAISGALNTLPGVGLMTTIT